MIFVFLLKVPNVSLLKELRWVNPQGEEIPQDDRYNIIIILWFGFKD